MRFSLRLLVALACLLLTSTVILGEDVGRELMQSTEEQIEQEREEDVLQAYYIEQSTFNSEQESMLQFGTEEAVTIVEKVEKANRKKQIRLFTHLWENAKGLTIVKALGILAERMPDEVEYYYEINSEAMERAESQGYSFKVSEALYMALSVTDTDNDHHHLLDALIYRMNSKDNDSKGSGCQYIEFLFTDAEVWANDEGRGLQFFQGFDDEKFLPLTECFLPECKGKAAKCCLDEEAVTSGMCGCKVVDKEEGTKQCNHNLVWTAPRTIWLCSMQKCEPDEKCLCADREKVDRESRKSRRRSRRSNEEDEESDEEEKKKEKKSKKKSKKSKKKSSNKGRNKT